LVSGKRGNRQDHIQDYFKAITGGKSSLIVNNNAAAVLLGINTLAEGKEVVVSRGQEVEIGGAFRIPDIIEKSGGILREVGTTNRTHKRDVEQAINSNTKLLLWVHTSNYKIQGFTRDLSLETLVEIGRKKRIPVMADLGSGAMENFSNLGLPKESMVHEIVKMKPQLITFSGDKLLGGPQSGIMIGSQRIINRCLQNPIYRTVRCDKFTIAFMEETLKVIGTSTQIKKNLTLSLLAEPGKKLLKRVNKILDTLPTKIKKTYGIHSIQTVVEAGSGSLPAESLPSAALVFSSNNMKPKELAKTFRHGHPSLIGYIHENKYFIDFKAVLKDQDKLVVQLIKENLG
jgi:L-seryl-tRNA(Ser) seleniumtransferase